MRLEGERARSEHFKGLTPEEESAEMISHSKALVERGFELATRAQNTGNIDLATDLRKKALILREHIANAEQSSDEMRRAMALEEIMQSKAPLYELLVELESEK
jgi:hypothetical protein